MRFSFPGRRTRRERHYDKQRQPGLPIVQCAVLHGLLLPQADAVRGVLVVLLSLRRLLPQADAVRAVSVYLRTMRRLLPKALSEPVPADVVSCAIGIGKYGQWAVGSG
jgi:hypothetical protein